MTCVCSLAGTSSCASCFYNPNGTRQANNFTTWTSETQLLAEMQTRVWIAERQRDEAMAALMDEGIKLPGELTCKKEGEGMSVYIVETYDQILDGPYVEPTCYANKEDAIRRVESQTYTDSDGIEHWACCSELKVVGE